MNKHTIYIIMFACAMVGCSGGSDVPAGGDRPSAPDGTAAPAAEAINFATNADGLTWDDKTRATTGAISDLTAVVEGFGVLAYLTENDSWTTATSGKAVGSDYPVPDFMFNQPVTWNTTLKHWGYSPMKYWPNTTDNSTAAGHRYVSFFAYAPFADKPFGTSGVTGMTNAADHSPYVVYTIDQGTTPVDLLWANNTDRERNGNGLIVVDEGTNQYQAVPLEFQHALACVDVYVQRVYDEPTYSGNTPGGGRTTKLFVRQLELSSTKNTLTNGLFKSGRLDLSAGTWSTDGTWADSSPAAPLTISYPPSAFADNVSGTLSEDPDDISNLELEKWGAAGLGVDEQERLLFKAGSIMLIPQSDELTIEPTLSYSMVTRGEDGDLEYSPYVDAAGNHYSRIVNTLKGNTLKLTLQAAKRYKLVIRISTEHIDFVIDSVENWDFPIRLENGAGDREDTTIDHKMNEE